MQLVLVREGKLFVTRRRVSLLTALSAGSGLLPPVRAVPAVEPAWAPPRAQASTAGRRGSFVTHVSTNCSWLHSAQRCCNRLSVMMTTVKGSHRALGQGLLSTGGKPQRRTKNKPLRMSLHRAEQSCLNCVEETGWALGSWGQHCGLLLTPHVAADIFRIRAMCVVLCITHLAARPAGCHQAGTAGMPASALETVLEPACRCQQSGN